MARTPVKSSKKKSLDEFTLGMNKYATRIIEEIQHKVPKASVDIRFVCQCYCLNLHPWYVVKQILLQYKQKELKIKK